LSHPKTEPDHVKNSKSRFETDPKIPSENKRKSSDFVPYGMAVIPTNNWQKGSRLQFVGPHSASMSFCREVTAGGIGQMMNDPNRPCLRPSTGPKRRAHL